MNVVYAYVLEAAFFDTVFSIYAVLGSAMIFLALIFGAFLRYKRQSAQTSAV